MPKLRTDTFRGGAANDAGQAQTTDLPSPSMRVKLATILIGFVFLNAGFRLAAQDLAHLATNCAIIKGAIAKFIEGTTDYTAVFQYQLFDPKGVPKVQLSMSTAVTKDRTRDDVFLMAMPQIPEERRAALKSVGLEKIVFATEFDTKRMYIVFPSMAVVQEVPISEEILNEVTARSGGVTLRKTPMESETVNGYACVKTLVEVMETNRAPERAIVSYASDLKQFPVKILFRKGDALHTIEFKNVQLVTPPAYAFEIPTNYTRIRNTDEVFRIAKERLQTTKAAPSPAPLTEGQSSK